jgi:hypothetical protein
MVLDSSGLNKIIILTYVLGVNLGIIITALYINKSSLQCVFSQANEDFQGSLMGQIIQHHEEDEIYNGIVHT